MPSTSEPALDSPLQPITQIANQLGLHEEELIPYGKLKAKVNFSAYERRADQPNGKLILVTAMTPTKYGEGKTTTAIGLGEAFGRLNENAMIAIREPSLGPIFGIKGGATGAGRAQVAPADEINMHFTGDFSAIEKANNLLAALIDNHIHHGNKLKFDTRQITFQRCFDMNDRALRNIIVGLGGTGGGIPREGGFQITAASEIMAILGLAKDHEDLRARLGRIVTGYTRDKEPIFARQLNSTGAMTALLRDAIHPNLVQTVENTPAFVHTGPFGNIAHGTSSVIATRLALKLCDYVITEAGFGSDLGAEKFFNIVSRVGEFAPSAVVLVATIRALKLHGGGDVETPEIENVQAVANGLENLRFHVENMRKFGVPVVVAINQFPTDSDQEIAVVREYCETEGIEVALSQVVSKGGEGGIELAQKIISMASSGKAEVQFSYDESDSLLQKIDKVAKNVYGAVGVEYEAPARRNLSLYEQSGFGKSYICMAKTQSSISDNPKLTGWPKGFYISLRDIEISAGAGFVVPIAGPIMRMPGLPAVPAAEHVQLKEDGEIEGI